MTEKIISQAVIENKISPNGNITKPRIEVIKNQKVLFNNKFNDIDPEETNEWIDY